MSYRSSVKLPSYASFFYNTQGYFKIVITLICFVMLFLLAGLLVLVFGASNKVIEGALIWFIYIFATLVNLYYNFCEADSFELFSLQNTLSNEEKAANELEAKMEVPSFSKMMVYLISTAALCSFVAGGIMGELNAVAIDQQCAIVGITAPSCYLYSLLLCYAACGVISISVFTSQICYLFTELDSLKKKNYFYFRIKFMKEIILAISTSSLIAWFVSSIILPIVK